MFGTRHLESLKNSPNVKKEQELFSRCLELEISNISKIAPNLKKDDELFSRYFGQNQVKSYPCSNDCGRTRSLFSLSMHVHSGGSSGSTFEDLGQAWTNVQPPQSQLDLQDKREDQ